MFFRILTTILLGIIIVFSTSHNNLFGLRRHGMRAGATESKRTNAIGNSDG